MYCDVFFSLVVLALSKCSCETIPSISGCTNWGQEMCFVLCPCTIHAVSFQFAMPSRKSIANSNSSKGFESVRKRINLGSDWTLCMGFVPVVLTEMGSVSSTQTTSVLTIIWLFPTSSGRLFSVPFALELVVKLGAQSFRTMIKTCVADLD